MLPTGVGGWSRTPPTVTSTRRSPSARPNAARERATSPRGHLYVGGDFTSINNGGAVLANAGHIARWDGLNWSALGSNGAGGSAIYGTEQVFAIAVSGSSVYVGGNFLDLNNNGSVLGAADNIARWDTNTNTWSALGRDGVSNGSLNAAVFAIAVGGSSVYAAGNFTDVNDQGTVLTAADYVSKWDATTGHWSAWAATVRGKARSTPRPPRLPSPGPAFTWAGDSST